jgi:hypothetical protein
MPKKIGLSNCRELVERFCKKDLEMHGQLSVGTIGKG